VLTKLLLPGARGLLKPGPVHPVLAQDLVEKYLLPWLLMTTSESSATSVIPIVMGMGWGGSLVSPVRDGPLASIIHNLWDRATNRMGACEFRAVLPELFMTNHRLALRQSTLSRSEFYFLWIRTRTEKLNMGTEILNQKQAKPSFMPMRTMILQRKCACG